MTRVRRQYNRLRPLAKLSREMRGWTLDVLNVVRSLVGAVREPPLPARHRFPPGSGRFSLADIYARADALARLHPANRHIEPKIRQQLQVLRDLGFLEFLGRGEYRLV